jgi:hypothetical protein
MYPSSYAKMIYSLFFFVLTLGIHERRRASLKVTLYPAKKGAVSSIKEIAIQATIFPAIVYYISSRADVLFEPSPTMSYCSLHTGFRRSLFLFDRMKLI